MPLDGDNYDPVMMRRRRHWRQWIEAIGWVAIGLAALYLVAGLLRAAGVGS